MLHVVVGGRSFSVQAIIFYSSDAFGNLDPLSEHGACPVIRGEKWGANVRCASLRCRVRDADSICHTPHTRGCHGSRHHWRAHPERLPRLVVSSSSSCSSSSSPHCHRRHHFHRHRHCPRHHHHHHHRLHHHHHCWCYRVLPTLRRRHMCVFVCVCVCVRLCLCPLAPCTTIKKKNRFGFGTTSGRR